MKQWDCGSCFFAILSCFLRRSNIRAGGICARRLAFRCCSFLSNNLAVYNVDDIISNISGTVEFAEARPEEFGVTQHPVDPLASVIRGLRIFGRGKIVDVPFFPSYRLDVHVLERLTPLLAVAAENRIHDHSHGHVWQMFAEHFM